MKTKQETKYEKQAREFAEGCGLTMKAVYLGHYPRLDASRITANYRVTLSRPGHVPYGFDFSTSINDSWFYRDTNARFTNTAHDGLPPRLDLDKFFVEPPNVPFQYRGFYIDHRRRAPSLYDVLACLTKYDPGTFKEFCSDYGYLEDSIKARDTWQAVVEEAAQVRRLFTDVMDELSEIN